MLLPEENNYIAVAFIFAVIKIITPAHMTACCNLCIDNSFEFR